MAISRFMAAVCSAIAAACSAMECSSVERRELVVLNTPSIGVESYWSIIGDSGAE